MKHETTNDELIEQLRLAEATYMAQGDGDRASVMHHAHHELEDYQHQASRWEDVAHTLRAELAALRDERDFYARNMTDTEVELATRAERAEADAKLQHDRWLILSGRLIDAEAERDKSLADLATDNVGLGALSDALRRAREAEADRDRYRSAAEELAREDAAVLAEFSRERARAIEAEALLALQQPVIDAAELFVKNWGIRNNKLSRALDALHEATTSTEES